MRRVIVAYIVGLAMLLLPFAYCFAEVIYGQMTYAVQDVDTGIFYYCCMGSDNMLYLGSSDGSRPIVDENYEGQLVLPVALKDIPVAGICPYAFKGCDKVTKVFIPECIDRIDARAFLNCPSTTKFVVGCESEVCQTHGELWSWVSTKPDYQVVGRRDYYCYKCMKFVKFENIPALDYISNGGPYTNQLENTYLVFYVIDGVARLESRNGYDPCIDENTKGRVVIPSTVNHGGHDYPVAYFGDLAFYWCKQITEVIVPPTVKELFYYTFTRTDALERIVFQGNAPRLVNWPLQSCPASIYVAPGTKGWNTVIPGIWEEHSIDYDFSDYAKAKMIMASTPAANPRFSQWDCYVIGLNADATDSKFMIDIKMVDGKPKLEWSPDLGEKRAYTLLGSEDLHSWTSIDLEDAGTKRFFKVQVDVP